MKNSKLVCIIVSPTHRNYTLSLILCYASNAQNYAGQKVCIYSSLLHSCSSIRHEHAQWLASTVMESEHAQWKGCSALSIADLVITDVWKSILNSP